MRLVTVGIILAVSVSCSTPRPQGGMASKEELADAYVAALQTRKRDALWALVHPTLVAKLDEKGRAFVEGVWERRMDLHLDPSADRHFKSIGPDSNRMLRDAGHVYVPITHTFQVEGEEKDGRGALALVYVNRHDNMWFITSIIPKQ